MIVEKQTWGNKNRIHINIIEENIGSVQVDIYPVEDDIAYLSYLYVQEQFRRKGYGRKLISRAESEIKSLGINKFGLWVNKGFSSDFTYEWYQKLGYKFQPGDDKDNRFMIKCDG